MTAPYRVLVNFAGREIELCGSESFVREHLATFQQQGFLPGALSGSSRPRKASAELSIDEFLAHAHPSQGKGALQDRVMLVAFYVCGIKRRGEFTTGDIEFYFSSAGWPPPKNLANTLGILKRKQGLVESGVRRGTYCLTPAGEEFVQGMLDRTLLP